MLLDLHIIYRLIDTESYICVRQGSFLSVGKMRKVVQLCVFYYIHFDQPELLHMYEQFKLFFALYHHKGWNVCIAKLLMRVCERVVDST